MKQTILILFISLIAIGCDSKKSQDDSSVDTTSIHLSSCGNPSLKQIYFARGCNGDVCGYHHYIMLNEYKESCFNNYDFIYLADMYLDSVKTNIPVNSIQFVKPFEFIPEYDSQDYEPLDQHSIAQIGYTDSTLNHKVPEIGYVSIWSNGNKKRLEYLQVSSRKHRMNIYNRNKK